MALLLVIAFFIGPIKMLGGGWLSYLLPDTLVLLIVFIIGSHRFLNRLPMFAASPLTLPILLVAALCILELANPTAPFIRSALGLRTWLLYLSFYFVGYYSLRSKSQIERLYTLLLVLGCITAAYGIYQWRAGPESFANWSEEYGRYSRIMWSAGLFRAFSTFLVPNTFGSTMGLLMMVALSVTASPRIQTSLRVAAGGAFVLMGLAIAASGTRAPAVELLIAAMIALALLPGIRRRMFLGVTGVALLIAAGTLAVAMIGAGITSRFSSVLSQDQLFWKWFQPLGDGLRIAVAHPFGMGAGYTGGVPQFIDSPALTTLPTTIIDSGYGSAAAELGLFGLGVFLYLVVMVAVEGIRAWKRIETGRLKDLMLAPTLFAALYPFIGLIGGIHASLPGSIYYWLLIGVLMKAPALQASHGELVASGSFGKSVLKSGV